LKILWLALLLYIATTASSANAQLGIYGKFDTTHVSAGDPNYESTAWYFGPGAGIYYDFLRVGPISLGADLRGDLLWGNHQKYRSALFGIRLAAKAPLLPIRPYVQGSAGAGGASHTGFNGSGTFYSNKFQYQVLGGMDYTIIPHIDLRLVEAGFGRMSGIGSGPGPAPASTLFVVSSGLVLRFP
jgi:hypothetical protein